MAKTKLGKLKANLARVEARQKTSSAGGDGERAHKGHFNREDEIKRLKACVKGEGKKPRMRGFAHKKDRAQAKRQEKADAKQKRGKEKSK